MTYHIGLHDILPFLEHLTTNQFVLTVPDSLAFTDGINHDIGLYVEHLNDIIHFNQNAIASGVKYSKSFTDTITFTQDIIRVYEPIIVDHLNFTQVIDRSFLFTNNLILSEFLVYDSGTFLPDTLIFTQLVTPNHKHNIIAFADILVFNSNVQIYVIPTRGNQGL